jgi:hypothetical protein
VPTFDALGVVLDAYDIAVIVSPDHLAQALRLDVLPPLSRVLGLHDDHVAAIAAFVEQSASSRTVFNGRNKFNQVASKRD